MVTQKYMPKKIAPYLYVNNGDINVKRKRS